MASTYAMACKSPGMVKPRTNFASKMLRVMNNVVNNVKVTDHLKKLFHFSLFTGEKSKTHIPLLFSENFISERQVGGNSLPKNKRNQQLERTGSYKRTWSPKTKRWLGKELMKRPGLSTFWPDWYIFGLPLHPTDIKKHLRASPHIIGCKKSSIIKALIELCCSSTLWENDRSLNMLNSHSWALLMCIQVTRRVKAKICQEKV